MSFFPALCHNPQMGSPIKSVSPLRSRAEVYFELFSRGELNDGLRRFQQVARSADALLAVITTACRRERVIGRINLGGTLPYLRANALLYTHEYRCPHIVSFVFRYDGLTYFAETGSRQSHVFRQNATISHDYVPSRTFTLILRKVSVSIREQNGKTIADGTAIGGCSRSVFRNARE